MKKINLNKTEHADAEIIAAIEEAEARGEIAICDNGSRACDEDAEEWERVEYTMRVVVGDDPLLVVWRPTEEGWRYVETHDGDESRACDWDEIDEVRHC